MAVATRAVFSAKCSTWNILEMDEFNAIRMSNFRYVV